MSSLISSMSPRDVNIALKRNESLEALCQRYHCEVADIRRQLQFLFRHDHESYFADFQRNSKRAQRDLNRKLAKMAARSCSAPAFLNQSTTDNTPLANPLTSLRERENELSSTVIALEEQSKRLNAAHQTRVHQLRDLQIALEKLRAELANQVTLYDQLLAENNQLVEQMNEISATRRQKLTELQQVRREIALGTPISIFFYADGSIETSENAEKVDDFCVDETGSEQLYADLLNSSLCQNLRVREIRILARAVAISRNTEYTLEPAFENPELESCFASPIH